MNQLLTIAACPDRLSAAQVAFTGVLLTAALFLAAPVSAASPETSTQVAANQIAPNQIAPNQMAPKEGKPAVMMKKRMMASSSIRDVHACNGSGIALAGIDVVSYHQATGPLMGHSEFTVLHDGLTYRFLSESNRQAFVDSPEKYLPSYLGWCATSLAGGALTCPNPLNYKLENGTLLLFETTGFTNGQNLWNSDPLDFRRRADKNRDSFLAATPSSTQQ